MGYTRREFLQMGGMATASMFLPGFLKALGSQTIQSTNGRVLIVVQMSGGNDGLNTIIPIRNDIYYKARPQLGLKPEDVLKLNDDIGINSALSGFKSLYDEGHLCILNTVGYPNPDRSHFRSMDIWHTASGSNEYVNTGWLGRYLDAECSTCTSSRMALEADGALSLSLKGERLSGMATTNPQQLYNSIREPYLFAESQAYRHTALIEDNEHITPLHYLYKTLADTYDTAEYLYDKTKIYKSTAEYPKGDFGNRMKMIGELICSGADARVYYVSLGSFDTHVGQVQRQKQLFEQLSAAFTALSEDLKKNNRFDDVMVMTFSEFGRRVAQNASAGTDHGTANCLFLMGGGLKKSGLYNAVPDLSNLDNGDLVYTIDFRQVYATMLRQWLQADDKTILGQNFPMLDFV